ncbi:type I-E CRISPR-associated protein Cas6/Cse3/CasE [Gordonia asplenii]|nr:type I-E CRISPR-associated protein Cas6/Cse3/CasE [Gordonia asplenii]
MSRIALNRRRRGAMKLLTNRHAMHAAVMSSFAPGTETTTDDGRVLWRVDRDGEELNLLIISPARPCLVHIAEQAGWTTENTWATRNYAPFLASIERGGRYLFRMVGNPTHTLSDGRGKRVVAHRTVEHQRNWLIGKGALDGFEVAASSADGGALALELSERSVETFRRQDRTVHLTTTRFDGELLVSDPDALRRALTHGVGRGKGYGCGLITLLPKESA